MAKSKFSKSHIAGTLLLSSTAIGAVASGTASANKVTDFLKNASGKLGGVVKSGVNMMLGNKISAKLDGHEQIVGTVTVGLLFALAYGTYRAIKAGVNYYVNKKNKNENSNLVRLRKSDYNIDNNNDDLENPNINKGNNQSNIENIYNKNNIIFNKSDIDNQKNESFNQNIDNETESKDDKDDKDEKEETSNS